MPTSKAIVIPAWVNNEKKKQQEGSNSIYNHLLKWMHWRPVRSMEVMLMHFTVQSSVRHQLTFIVDQIKKHLAEQDPNPVVARISMSKYIPKEIIVSFASNVRQPVTIANVVLRLSNDGGIKEVAREYSMSYTADKNQPTLSHERNRAKH